MPFINFGLIGIILVLLITKKWIVPRWTMDDAIAAKEELLQHKEALLKQLGEDIDELQTTNSALRELTETQIIPALVASNELVRQYAPPIGSKTRGTRANG